MSANNRKDDEVDDENDKGRKKGNRGSDNDKAADMSDAKRNYDELMKSDRELDDGTKKIYQSKVVFINLICS